MSSHLEDLFFLALEHGIDLLDGSIGLLHSNLLRYGVRRARWATGMPIHKWVETQIEDLKRDELLLRAYQATTMTLKLPEGDVTLPASTRLPSSISPSAWVMTAWNPLSPTRSVEETPLRNAKIREACKKVGATVRPAVLRSTDGKWVEDSIFVTGIDIDQIMAVAWRYQCKAVFEVTEQGLRVLGCAPSVVEVE